MLNNLPWAFRLAFDTFVVLGPAVYITNNQDLFLKPFLKRNRLLRKRHPEDVILDETNMSMDQSNKLMSSLGFEENY